MRSTARLNNYWPWTAWLAFCSLCLAFPIGLLLFILSAYAHRLLSIPSLPSAPAPTRPARHRLHPRAAGAAQ